MRGFVLLVVSLFVLLGGVGCRRSGQHHLERAQRYLRAGDLELARRHLEKAQALSETNYLVWHEWGVLHHLKGDFSNAVYAYRKAISLNPSAVETRLNLGFLYLTVKMADQAKREFTSCIQVAESNPHAWVGMGYASLLTRDLNGAERAFVEAIRLSSNNARAWNGWALVQVQRGRYQEASRGFQKAIDCDSLYAPAFLNGGVIALDYLENVPLAVQRLERYLLLEPNGVESGNVRKLLQRVEPRVK